MAGIVRKHTITEYDDFVSKLGEEFIYLLLKEIQKGPVNSHNVPMMFSEKYGHVCEKEEFKLSDYMFTLEEVAKIINERILDKDGQPRSRGFFDPHIKLMDLRHQLSIEACKKMNHGKIEEIKPYIPRNDFWNLWHYETTPYLGMNQMAEAISLPFTWSMFDKKYKPLLAVADIVASFPEDFKKDSFLFRTYTVPFIVLNKFNDYEVKYENYIIWDDKAMYRCVSNYRLERDGRVNFFHLHPMIEDAPVDLHNFIQNLLGIAIDYESFFASRKITKDMDLHVYNAKKMEALLDLHYIIENDANELYFQIAKQFIMRRYDEGLFENKDGIWFDNEDYEDKLDELELKGLVNKDNILSYDLIDDKLDGEDDDVNLHLFDADGYGRARCIYFKGMPDEDCYMWKKKMIDKRRIGYFIGYFNYEELPNSNWSIQYPIFIEVPYDKEYYYQGEWAFSFPIIPIHPDFVIHLSQFSWDKRNRIDDNKVIHYLPTEVDEDDDEPDPIDLMQKNSVDEEEDPGDRELVKAFNHYVSTFRDGKENKDINPEEEAEKKKDVLLQREVDNEVNKIIEEELGYKNNEMKLFQDTVNKGTAMPVNQTKVSEYINQHGPIVDFDTFMQALNEMNSVKAEITFNGLSGGVVNEKKGD